MEFQSGRERIPFASVVLLISADPTGLNSTCFSYVPRDAGSNLVLIPPLCAPRSVGEDPRGSPGSSTSAVPRSRNVRSYLTRERGISCTSGPLYENNVHRRCSSAERPLAIGDTTISNRVLPLPALSFYLFLSPTLSFLPRSYFYV